jgi:hypothetical protein
MDRAVKTTQIIQLAKSGGLYGCRKVILGSAKFSASTQITGVGRFAKLFLVTLSLEFEAATNRPKPRLRAEFGKCDRLSATIRFRESSSISLRGDMRGWFRESNEASLYGSPHFYRFFLNEKKKRGGPKPTS